MRYSRRIFGKGLVINEGAHWLQQRRLIQPAFHRERIEGYAAIMVGYTERMMRSWQDGQARDIHEDMMRLTLEIVAKTLFDVEIAGERDQISMALNTVMELSSGAWMLVPPALRLLPTPGNVRYRRAMRRLDKIVYGLIDLRVEQRMAERSGAESQDLLNTLLDARDDAGAAMPAEQLRDEVMTILLTGHETTAVSLSWTFYLLSKSPVVEQRLWDELQGVLNGRSPAMHDLSQLQYTERVVKEAMRLYPPVWAVVRNPIEDCEIGGYRVPAGASVLMSQWVMHRDPRHYDDPERFNPDRWLDERTKAAPKFAYFPFGGGPRSCIGASFATMEAALILATVAQRYQVRVASDACIEPLPAITLRPKHGIPVTLTRRANDASA